MIKTQTQCSTITLSSARSMLNSLQNGSCSFILAHTTNAKTSTKKQFLYFSQFLHPYSTLTFSQNLPCNPLLTLPASISHQFSTPLFLCTTIPTIYIKNIFPTSTIFLIQAASRGQGARASWVDWHCFSLFLVLQSMDSDNRNHNQSRKISVLQVWQIIQSTFSHTLNLLSLLSYPTNTKQELTFPWKQVAQIEFHTKFSILIY